MCTHVQSAAKVFVHPLKQDKFFKIRPNDSNIFETLVGLVVLDDVYKILTEPVMKI